MKIGFGIHRLILVLGAILWLIVFLACSALALMAIGDGQLWDTIWILLAMIGGYTALLWVKLYHFPEVILGETGVFVRVLWRKRFYYWNEIKQAGILFCPGRGIPYERLYFVTPKGSKRRHKDHLFRIRNVGKLIMIPAKMEIRNYVVSHYGPLDFDLSYGKAEQSTVDDASRP